MKIAWSRPELQRLCQSSDGLVRLCPYDAREAQQLLSIIAGADTLLELSRFQCVDLTVQSSPIGGSVGITARLIEVTLKGAPMNAATDSTAVLAEPAWMRSVNAIVVGDLRGRDTDTMKASA